MWNEYDCIIEFYNDKGWTYSRPINLQISKCFKKENYIRLYIMSDDCIKFTFSTDDDVYIKLKIFDKNDKKIFNEFPNDKRDFRLNKLYNQFHNFIGKKCDFKKKWIYTQCESRIQWEIKSLHIEKDNEYTKEIFKLLEPYSEQ